MDHILAIFKDIIDLIDDYRYLAAAALYEELIESSKNFSDGELNSLKTEQINHSLKLQQLHLRKMKVHQVLNSAETDDQWIHVSELFGISTHYQADPSDGTLTIKMEGVLEDSPLFELCAVLYEVDLYKSWLPFCNESMAVDHIGKAEILP
jgi:hypothetical protein